MTAVKNRGSVAASKQADAAVTDSPIFTAQDWAGFRSLRTLPRKAGVPEEELVPLVLKELVDNALDSGGEVEVDDDETFVVQDDGAGIPGTDEEIAALFSIGRPLASSKALRMPTRGALGNGLRVVVGTVLASGGTLAVATRGRRLELVPQDDGTTAIESVVPWDEKGTRIEISFGCLMTFDAWRWAEPALELAGGETYRGKPSPWWYDDDAFFELMQASTESARDLVGRLDGCSGRKAGQIAGEHRGQAARDLSRAESAALLARARSKAKRVRPTRLGAVGALDGWDGYKVVRGEVTIRTEMGGEMVLPVVVEAWSRPGNLEVDLLVNRTRATGELRAYPDHQRKASLRLHGCGLDRDEVKTGKGRRDWLVNVQTPYMPITSDGKRPELSSMSELITKAMGGAARQFRVEVRGAVSVRRSAPRQSIKAAVFGAIPSAAHRQSQGGRLPFGQRKLFYVVRDAIALPDLNWGTFTKYVKEYEETHGDIPMMVKDPRGTLYHPHTGEEIPLGTLAVQSYARPPWTFSRILYIEKEGFAPLLKAVQWGERWDCAVASTKGQTVRALRDLFGLLGAHAEPIEFYCVHDADGYGTQIFATLKAEAAKRGCRVVDLGLNPDEVVDLGLDPEELDKPPSQIGPHVSRRERAWIREHRFELDNLPDFIGWLDSKMSEHTSGKLIPPNAVLRKEYIRQARHHAAAAAVAKAIAGLKVPDPATPPGDLRQRVKGALEAGPTDLWRDAADDLVEVERVDLRGILAGLGVVL